MIHPDLENEWDALPLDSQIRINLISTAPDPKPMPFQAKPPTNPSVSSCTSAMRTGPRQCDFLHVNRVSTSSR